MERKKRYKIKQMMPIPEGYEVMQAIVQGDGSRMMEAAADSIFPYCLVLLEGEGNGDDHIELYNLFPGYGVEEHGESMLVPTRYCERCGKRVVPHMRGLDETTLFYTCGCFGRDCGKNGEE